MSQSTSPGRHPSSEVHNPEHHVPQNIRDLWTARQKDALELLNLQNDLGLPEINENYANGKLDIFQALLQPAKINLKEAVQGLKDAKKAYIENLESKLQTQITRRRSLLPTKLSDVPSVIPKPNPPDPNFWWAETNFIHTTSSDVTFESLKDGLHFNGGPEIHDNSDSHESFGAIARFAIEQERFPPSPSGIWLSIPFVELFGGVTASAPDWDVIQGHGIASCDLYLRQTLFQFGLGGSIIVAERVQAQGIWDINLEDGNTTNLPLPGHTDLPSLSFSKSKLTAADKLWAEIEVRFDIYLKSAGALVWCDPEIILRTFQWPLVAI